MTVGREPATRFLPHESDHERQVRLRLAGAVRPYLSLGSVLAFDQIGHAKWPGETAALREILGSGQARLNIFPGRATLTYLRWGGQ